MNKNLRNMNLTDNLYTLKVKIRSKMLTNVKKMLRALKVLKLMFL